MIRTGSTVAYVTYETGDKDCGIGKVIEIRPEYKACLVSDNGTLHYCLLEDCENVCNWQLTIFNKYDKTVKYYYVTQQL